MAAFSVAIQWVAFYYWMRIIPELGFYVTFLIEVTKDISYFTIMFAVCIIMVGNATYIIDKAGRDDRFDPTKKNDELINPATLGEKLYLLNALMNQY